MASSEYTNSGYEAASEAALAEAISAGARLVVFKYTISLVFVTFRRSSAVKVVPPGGSAVLSGLPYTLLTIYAGWWGIPWGPIYTLDSLRTNLRGGIDITEAVASRLPRPVHVPPRARAEPRSWPVKQAIVFLPAWSAACYILALPFGGYDLIEGIDKLLVSSAALVVAAAGTIWLFSTPSRWRSSRDT